MQTSNSCYACKLRPFASWPFIRRSVEYLDASADRESASLEHIEATNWNTQLNGFRLQNQTRDCRNVPGKKDPGA